MAPLAVLDRVDDNAAITVYLIKKLNYNVELAMLVQFTE